jgi:hypothetical protein
MTHHNLHAQHGGFALLMTLLVVSAIVSITATIVELSMKQLDLSVTSRDSEIAFHAANSGMECARYTRRMASTTFDTLNPGSTAGDIPFYCFNGDAELEQKGHPLDTIDEDDEAVVFRFAGDIDWPTGDRCSLIDMVVIVPRDGATDSVEITNLEELYLGFTGTEKECDPGEVCTVAQVTGYSAACADKDAVGVVRREILLEF